jgi:hypothetical protein
MCVRVVEVVVGNVVVHFLSPRPAPFTALAILLLETHDVSANFQSLMGRSTCVGRGRWVDSRGTFEA